MSRDTTSVELLRLYFNPVISPQKLLQIEQLALSSLRVGDAAPGRRRQKRLSRDEINSLLADRRDGTKVKELAAKYGVNRQTVAQHLSRRDVDTRYRALTEAQVADARDLYEGKRLTLSQVADELGASASSVRYALVARGVTMRGRWDYEKDCRS